MSVYVVASIVATIKDKRGGNFHKELTSKTKQALKKNCEVDLLK